MQKARSHPVNARRHPHRLLPLVSTRFQVLFHSPPGVLFTFPSRYSSTIGRSQYLALEGGPPRFRQGFSGPALLGVHGHQRIPCSPTGLSPRAVGRSRPLRLHEIRPAGTSPTVTPQPRDASTTVWALPRSIASTWGISSLISLPPGTEMFQFPGLASHSRGMTGHDARRVAPFGDPRINGCLLLPRAFRSLPRPSSPGCT
jgi:hypothetical protein